MHGRRAKRPPLLAALILLTSVMAIIGSIVVLSIRIPDHSPALPNGSRQKSRGSSSLWTSPTPATYQIVNQLRSGERSGVGSLIKDARKQVRRAHLRSRSPIGWRVHPETLEELISLAATCGIDVTSRPDWLLGYPIQETKTVEPGRLTLICREPAKTSLITVFRSMLNSSAPN